METPAYLLTRYPECFQHPAALLRFRPLRPAEEVLDEVLDRARALGVDRLLAERLRYGAAHGATMALVKGRIETSGPILRRAGFAPYGPEWSYLVPL